MTAFAGVRRWFHLERPVEVEIDEELAFHFERSVEELVARGMTREAATAEALRRFGNDQEYRRQLKQLNQLRRTRQRRTEYLALLSRNVRLAWRGIRRNPGFALVVALTMGLGIGINSSMFSVLDHLLFAQPALVRDPDLVRRVYVTRSPRGEWIYGSTMTYPDVIDLKRAKNLSGVFAYTNKRFPLGRGEGVQLIPATIVEPGWFELLGVKPVLGRFFEPSDDSAAAGLANVVIGYGLWQRQFGESPSALGKELEIGVGRYTVIGVAPKGFAGLSSTRTDAWLPLTPASVETIGGDWKHSRGHFWLSAVAKVKAGVDINQAEAEVSSLHLAGRSADDSTYAGKQHARITLGPLLEARGPASGAQNRVALWAGAVSFAVLLVACANVANLLLFRAVRRRREIAVRLALGISRGQLVSELLTESLVLALIGGVGALILAFFGSSLLNTLIQPGLAETAASFSWRVASFTLCAALSAGLLAGLIPAWLESRPDLLQALKEVTTGRGGHQVIRRGLVVLQTALSVTLLIGSGLFLLSFHRIRSIDIGIPGDQVLVIAPRFPGSYTDAARVAFFQRAEERLSQLAGVEHVTSSTTLPFNQGWGVQMTIPGFDSIPHPPSGGPYLDGVSTSFFETTGIGIVQGRGFQAGDIAGSALVAVVGETMARNIWPNESPLGKCLKFGDASAPCREIVGVAHDTQRSLEMLKGEVRSQYYYPIPQLPPPPDAVPPQILMLRSSQPLLLSGAVRSLLVQLEPRLRFVETQTFEQMYTPTFQSWKTGAGLFTAFGALALLVAAVGLYSLLAYGVAQRTREIGVRIALGARAGRVIGLVLQEGVLLVIAGVIIGLGVAVLAAKSAAPLLFKTQPTEPVVYLGVAFVLMLIAIAAGTLPAWRATRVSPMTALRAE